MCAISMFRRRSALTIRRCCGCPIWPRSSRCGRRRVIAACHRAHPPLFRARLLRRQLQRCAPSDGIPTLKRVEIIDNAVRVVSLAEGVINMQVEYAFDTNDDGSPEQFLTSTTAGATPTSFWSNVVAVRLHMLMRSTEAGTYRDDLAGRLRPGPGAQRRDLPGGIQVPAWLPRRCG